MLQPQFLLPLADELVIDLFAGGGGASTGIEQAIGRHVDIAVNHDAAAVSLHQGTTLQTLGRLRVALQKRGIDAAAEALQREAARFFEPVPPPPSPGAALAAAWKASPQQPDLFA